MAKLEKAREAAEIDWVRLLIHLPVGAFAAWLILIQPVTGFVFSFGFMFYEAIEDWRIRDRSYKDVFGFLIGLGGGAAGLYVFVR